MTKPTTPPLACEHHLRAWAPRTLPPHLTGHVLLCPSCATAAASDRTVTAYQHLTHLPILDVYGDTMTATLPAPPITPTHRRATIPDTARMHPRQPAADVDLEGAVASMAVRWLATGDPDFRTLGRNAAHDHVDAIHFDELRQLRTDVTADAFRARLDVDDIAAETRVYLEAALAPGVTYAAINLYVSWVTTDGPHDFAHAAALAAAALRGWNHRHALATGGAR
ncbi:hypothetical protein QVL82_01205 [Cellulosimicrobium funkei]|uniref:hypothetical protein n=1 Tax=Cellulosimicrobium funkei TaxID=264251 RepID=UPI0037577CAD